jgi:hypothetical protein
MLTSLKIERQRYGKGHLEITKNELYLIHLGSVFKKTLIKSVIKMYIYYSAIKQGIRNVTFPAYKKYDNDDIYNVTSPKIAILNGISLRHYNFRIIENLVLFLTDI